MYTSTLTGLTFSLGTPSLILNDRLDAFNSTTEDMCTYTYVKS